MICRQKKRERHEQNTAQLVFRDFNGTTVGEAGTGVELPCGFAQW